MLKAFPQIGGDSLIYGNLAKGLLLHGRFALTDGSGVPHATLIRLPGYPLFLALCFRLFGVENYTAVAWAQIAIELVGCLLLADFARRVSSLRAGLNTLWLAALCPFTAAYCAAPLTETLTLAAICLALWSLARFREKTSWPMTLAFGCAIGSAAMLRPDGALVAVALWPAMLFASPTGPGGRHPAPDRSPRWTWIWAWIRTRIRTWIRQRVRFAPAGAIGMALIAALLAITPFGLWAARNWRVFHVFEPLAPRYANDPGESSNPGYQRWVKTWCLDFVSTYQIYWNVPGAPLDIHLLPSRAFDSAAQYAETAALATDYNAGQEDGQEITPALDARFAHLADERIRAHPVRYYLLLPLGRLADMWFRPRIENLPIDLDWWVYKHHFAETRFAWCYVALNAILLALAVAGLCLRPRFWPYLLAYPLLRSALLFTVEVPEARYTLECFPMVFALSGIALARLFRGPFRGPFRARAAEQARPSPPAPF